MIEALYAALLAFALCLVLGPVTIGYLRKLKFGQSVRTDGPREHLKKSGTPTMGGVLIILAFTVATFAFSPGLKYAPWALLATLGFGLVGLIDDYIIVVAKHPLGLKARQKLAGQVVVALALGFFAASRPELGTGILIPFINQVLVLPWWLYVAFVAFIATGFSNAVNLTDGLDGLAAGTMTIAAVAYIMIALLLGQPEMAVFAAATAGACLGFVWFNAHPAQIFMGDTGSLALGGALAALAVLTKTELFLVVIGGVFVAETLSVMIQVTTYRLTGKRVFKMAPLHHHFELSGWPETKVVTRFWLVGLVLAFFGLIMVPGVL
ncbi:MAG: phospho-N-acetylmuramoyl-pentapeptide-transferase [Firmicutes bacterium]|nr:phospho-N-acetylmuramoyl-pentapeptide-transferase [Bacillota bacterium]